MAEQEERERCSKRQSLWLRNQKRGHVSERVVLFALRRATGPADTLILVGIINFTSFQFLQTTDIRCLPRPKYSWKRTERICGLILERLLRRIRRRFKFPALVVTRPECNARNKQGPKGNLASRWRDLSP